MQQGEIKENSTGNPLRTQVQVSSQIFIPSIQPRTAMRIRERWMVAIDLDTLEHDSSEHLTTILYSGTPTSSPNILYIICTKGFYFSSPCFCWCPCMDVYVLYTDV